MNIVNKIYSTRQVCVSVLRTTLGMSLCIATLPAVAAVEPPLSDWHIYGSNTLRASVYASDGPVVASPYPFEGGMFYNELNLYFNKKDTRYSSWRGEFSGVYNVNDNYRYQPDFGIIPERLNLTRENGAAAIPYRLQLGDSFSYFSYLTMQRSIKGAQLEFQPVIQGSDFRHSVVAFSGASQSSWRGLAPSDDYSNGLSWLMVHPEQGSLNFNLVHNTRNENVNVGTLDRSQYVFSIAGERPFSYGGQDFTFEAEAASFNGDHNGTTGAVSGQGRSDQGYFVQLSGDSQALPWDYQLKAQYYGQDFQPRGSVVTPDRRSTELFSNWRFNSGVMMRLRAQSFEDAFETTNPLSTDTYGVNFTGSLARHFLPGLVANVDFYTQDQRNQLRSIDRLSNTFSASLSKPLPRAWNGRLALFFQDIDDVTAVNSDASTRQIIASADHAFNVLGFKGYITPGVLYREVSGTATDSEDWNPTLAVSLAKAAHSLRMNYGELIQNRNLLTSGPDLRIRTFNLNYKYTKKQHIFGVEANLLNRGQQNTASTDASRLSVYWTYQFDKPPTRLAAVTGTSSRAAQLAANAWLSPGLLGLAPLVSKKTVEKALQNENIANAAQQGEYTVYEVNLLKNIAGRQRLALEYQADVLYRSGMIVDLDAMGGGNSVAQTFERVRESLMRELGSPTRTFEEGEFSAAFIQDVNNQRLIRIVEWQTDSGIVRLGIPRRLDGQVRIEIQHAKNFPSARQTLWSLEAVR